MHKKLLALFFGFSICLAYFMPVASCADITVENIRFIEGPYDLPDGPHNYADSFSNNSTRYVYSQVDYSNKLYGVREHTVNITWKYYYPDGELMGEIEDQVTVYSEWPSSWVINGWGWNESGNWPIGTYTVKIFVEGSFAAEDKFSIYGDGSSEQASSNLYNAVLDNDIENVKDILSKGGDPNVTNFLGMTALNAAAGDGNIEIVKLLLDNGADINGVDLMLGWTPLMSAANDGHNEIVKLLIKRGADIDIQDTGGYTALIYAATAGETEAAKILIDAGADIDHISGGYSALTSAVEQSHPETAKLLLENNADPDALMKDGQTSLIAAVKNGNIEIVKALLDNGADISIKDDKGRTALEWAEFEQQEEMVKLLKEAEKININGDWDGIWTNPQGHIYLLKFSLNIKDPKNVKTAFNWTLNASPVADEQSKIGRSSVEHVKGTYDANKRTLNLEGYEEKDSDKIIGLDKYKLAVSLDGSSIRGRSEHGGDWQGKFSANKRQSFVQNLIRKMKQKWSEITKSSKKKDKTSESKE